jgi:transposase InsO family protein
MSSTIKLLNDDKSNGGGYGFKLEQFDGTNYVDWRESIILLFKKQKLWRYITDEKDELRQSKPKPLSEADQQSPTKMDEYNIRLDDWESKNVDALLLFKGSVTKSFLHYTRCKSAAEVWDNLRLEFGGIVVMDIVSKKKALMNIRINQDETITDFSKRLNVLITDLESNNVSILDEDKKLYIVNALATRREFDSTIEALDLRGKSYKSLELIGALKEKEAKILNANSDNKETKIPISEQNALKAQLRAAKVLLEQHGNMVIQDNCKKSSFKKRINLNKQIAFKPKCSVCNKRGHKTDDCWYKDEEEKSQTKPYSQKAANKGKQVSFTSLSMESLMSSSEAHNSDIVSNKWIIDSGATSHMTAHRNWFSEYMALQPDTVTVKVANGKLVDAVGIGNVKLTTQTKRGTVSLELQNVLYVPELQANLYSVKKAASFGINTIFSKHGCILSKHKTKTVVATGSCIQDMYILNADTDIDYGTNEVVTSLLSYELWHARLGHLNRADTKDVLARQQLQASHMNSDSKCEVCCTEKMKKAPTLKESQWHATACNELVHADIFGPMENSLSGLKYALVYIDDYSRQAAVYLLKNKSEQSRYFKLYKAYAEKKIGLPIKSVRTDNGGEFTSNEYEEFLQTNGIQHHKSTPYTPQQNGVVERYNQTVKGMMRCMLRNAGLPITFWAEAVQTANYILNRTPKTALDGRTPYELWNSRPPAKIRHFRVFGCTAFVFNHLHRSSDSRGVKHIFLGYSTSSKGYRLYHLDTGKITISKDVVFDETRFSYRSPKMSQANPRTNNNFSLGQSNPYDALIDEVDEDIVYEQEPNADHLSSASEGENVDQESDNEEEEAKDNDQPQTSFFEPKRYPTRARRPPTQLHESYTHHTRVIESVLSAQELDPKSFRQAITSPEKDEWKAAMKQELDSRS